jgi:hypothetical protein
LKKESINDTDLFLAFCQIVEGCSEKVFLGNPIFIKHVTLKERQLFNKKYKTYFAYAISKGLPTEEDALKKAINEGFWSEKEDEEIKVSEKYIETLNITRKKVFKKLQVDEIEKNLREEKEKIAKKLAEKKQVLGKTAEDYASSRSGDYLIYSCFYKDKDLTKLLFSEEEFDEMPLGDLEQCVILYNNYFNEISDLNIQHIALSDFFQPNYLVLDYPTELFGKPMVQLSENQTRLLIYAKIFKNIFETTENIPENIKKDPEALLQYKDKSQAQKEFESKTKPKKRGNVEGAEMVFGATKDEIGQDTKTLKDVMKDKAVLSMEELMKLHGQ